MDMYEFDSSDDNRQVDNHSSSGGKTTLEALSTDDRSEVKKSKMIKKHYEPIRDGNIYIRYEDDPAEYKRIRKKIQNRQSAARVRGRKKGTMESLQVQVQELKKVNSELMLRNATLQTENRSLKNQIQFLRGIVKPNKQSQQTQSIDKYLNLSSNPKNQQMKPEQQFESPFQQEDSSLNWIRSPLSSGYKSNWSTLFIVTILVCVFIVPSGPQDNNTMIAQQTGSSVISYTPNTLQNILCYAKIVTKYATLLVYLIFAGSFAYSKYQKRKLKKF